MFVRHLWEEDILSKFEYQERIIKCSRANGHFPIRPTPETIQRTYLWPNMYKQVESLLEKCDLWQRYTKQVKSLKEWRGNPLPQRPWNSISVDSWEMPASQQKHVAILNIQDDLLGLEFLFLLRRWLLLKLLSICFMMLHLSLELQRLFVLKEPLVLLERWLLG